MQVGAQIETAPPPSVSGLRRRSLHGHRRPPACLSPVSYYIESGLTGIRSPVLPVCSAGTDTWLRSARVL